eukprot:CAMPEP_0203854782 /NCGR_PEP_ID=MMETSP0359-20131031/9281_1 /ASSEMBLY_ACC=CAM_ASM_000338 /TAXON_ID=268821 /ORGANISM="Scrippsiella Hangoei, Strain SHTV-5" /LENGTH=897 /DNA_ID=CAMNT_0050771283 /DNA_START=62 /DNA_END=2755 /DNA_ORIENTATION=+
MASREMLKPGKACWRSRKENVVAVVPEIEATSDERTSPTAGKPSNGAAEMVLHGRNYELGAVVFFVGCIVTFVLVRPQQCADVLECSIAANEQLWEAHSMHSHIAVGTGAFLSREVMNFVQSRTDTLDQRMAAFRMPDSKLSEALMCTLLAVLLVTQTLFACGKSWPHAVPPAASFAQTWGVQHTVRYLDWMVSVPLLLVIAGHIALGRPLSELRVSILMTNVYMLLAWAALLVPDAVTRWILIISSFALYFFASFDMARWARRFNAEAPKDIPARPQRIFLVQFLVFVFGLYGVNYLLAATGAISHHSEHLVYGMGDIIAKMITGGMLCFVRTAERREALGEIILKHSSLNTAFVSLLRAGFDHLLPCTIDGNGTCWLPEKHTPDGQILESILNRPMSGAFNDLIADDKEQAKFKDFVQERLQQVQNECARDLADTQHFWKRESSVFAAMPSVAQLFMCDLGCRNDAGTDAGILRVGIHVAAAVPPGPRRSNAKYETVLAFRILSERLPADISFRAESHNHEIDLTSPLEVDFGWQRMKSCGSAASGQSHRGIPLLPSVGPWEPGEQGPFRRNVSCEEGDPSVLSELSWTMAGTVSGSRQRRRLTQTGAMAARGMQAQGKEDDLATLATLSDTTSNCFSELSAVTRVRQVSGPTIIKSGASTRASGSLATKTLIREPPLLGAPDHKLNGSIGSRTREVECQAGVECRDQATATSICWLAQGFTCKTCAKPPTLPEGGPRSPGSRSRRRSCSKGLNSSTSSNSSPRSSGAISDNAGRASGHFDGAWVLIDDGSTLILDVSPWLRFLQIQGIEVIDGMGRPCHLIFDSQGTLLCGGYVSLSKDGDVLLRNGKSGRALRFQRVLDGRLFDSECSFAQHLPSLEPKPEHEQFGQQLASNM